MKPEIGVRRFDPVAFSSESTVVAEYVAESHGAEGFQSESALETEFVRLLGWQAYELLPITTEADLVANRRNQLEIVNDFVFSDSEWDRFFSTAIASAGDGPIEKTVRVQEDHVQLLTRDDGSTKNITLLDTANIQDRKSVV